MARRAAGFARAGASALDSEDTGVMYRLGLTINELRERFATDSQTQTADEMMRLYGRQGKHLQHPSSQHLQSPLLKDQYDIQYTPVESGTTLYWYARISPAKAKLARQALFSGASVKANKIGGDIYPPPGTPLRLTRFRAHPPGGRFSGGADPEEVLSTTVQSFETNGRVASTLITFETAVSSVLTEHELNLYAKRAAKHGVQLGTERAY